MKTLVPIRIKIGRGHDADGMKHAKYPDFNQLKPELRQGMDWCYYIDAYGLGIHYDKVENLGKGAEFEFACTCVPKSFADAAVKTFGADVEIISEEEWADFFNNRAHHMEDTEHLDTLVLQGILARVELENQGIAPKPSSEILALRKQCLDPACSDKFGIRKNERKTWAQYKELRGIKIV